MNEQLKDPMIQNTTTKEIISYPIFLTCWEFEKWTLNSSGGIKQR